MAYQSHAGCINPQIELDNSCRYGQSMTPPSDLQNDFIPEQHLALFLDLDGTLVDIATTPDAVVIPASLKHNLALAAQYEQGALAMISGRSLLRLDELLAPANFPAAGQHGLERRNAAGVVWRANMDAQAYGVAAQMLRELRNAHPGLLLEEKGISLALHYRVCPELEATLSARFTALAQQLAPQVQIKRGKFVLELLPNGFSKGTAIAAFMREPPFIGRTPVFIGDDLTDEDGFAAVNDLNGYSVRVGDGPHTLARFRLADVAAVNAWLKQRYATRAVKRIENHAG